MLKFFSLAKIFAFDKDKKYREYFFQRDYLQSMIGMAFLLIPAGIFIYSDYTLLKFSFPFYLLLVIRLSLIACGLAAVVIFSKKKNFIFFDWYNLLFMLYGAFTSFYTSFTRPVNYVHNFIFDIVVVMAFYMVIPIRVSFRIIAGVFYTLLTGYTFLFIKVHTSQLVVHTTIVCNILVNVFGIIIAKRMSEYRYQQYQTQIQDEILKQELSLSNDELKEMAYILAHDLKSPLSGIIGNLSLLLDNSLLEKNEHDFCRGSLNSARSMNKIIDDLLVFSTIDKKQIYEESVNVHKVINRVLESFAKEIFEYSIRIEVGEMPVVKASFTLFTLLFQNLIQNAIKYRSATNPFIAIQYEFYENQHVFKIQDNGIGISTEQQYRVFHLFYRAHQKNDISGSGIGLSTCKKIAEMYRGRISVESQENQGTIFTIAFPELSLPLSVF